MLNSDLCDFSDAHIHVKVTVTTANMAAGPNTNNITKKVLFKNCATFPDCMNEINNTQIYNEKTLMQ